MGDLCCAPPSHEDTKGLFVSSCLGGARFPRCHAGFTLAELIVASTLITVIMAAVYVAFGNTLRVWRQGEEHLHTFQDVRSAVNILSRDLDSIVGGSEHLFQGDDNALEFFAVGQPMDVERGEGARVLWVQYRLNRAKHVLVREEAVVNGALPVMPPDGKDVDHARIKLSRKHKYDLAANVRAMEIEYCWIPPQKRGEDEPPQWVEPVIKDESREGWGLPQGLRIALTFDDSTSEKGKTTFTKCVSFRGPTTPYDEKKLGHLGGGRP